MRHDGRGPGELRTLEIVPGFVEQAHGSALISFGRTRVLCTATIEEGVPRWLAGGGRGWLTAEYGMLPGSTGVRTQRGELRIRERTGERQRAAQQPRKEHRARIRKQAGHDDRDEKNAGPDDIGDDDRRRVQRTEASLERGRGRGAHARSTVVIG